MIHLIIYKIVAYHIYLPCKKKKGVEYFTEIGSGKSESLILYTKKEKKKKRVLT